MRESRDSLPWAHRGQGTAPPKGNWVAFIARLLRHRHSSSFSPCSLAVSENGMVWRSSYTQLYPHRCLLARRARLQVTEEPRHQLTNSSFQAWPCSRTHTSAPRAEDPHRSYAQGKPQRRHMAHTPDTRSLLGGSCILAKPTFLRKAKGLLQSVGGRVYCIRSSTQIEHHDRALTRRPRLSVSRSVFPSISASPSGLSSCELRPIACLYTCECVWLCTRLVASGPPLGSACIVTFPAPRAALLLHLHPAVC